jgi:WD40 repeat protein
MSWSADGRRLALTLNWVVRICDTTTGAVVRDITASGNEEMHLTFTPTGRLLLVECGYPGDEPRVPLRVRDPESDKLRLAVTIDWPGHAYVIYSEVFGEDDQRLYLALGERVVRLLLKTGELTALFQQKARITGFAVRADEKLAVTIGGNSAHVWNLPDGSRKLELKHLKMVSGAAFVPGERLLTACYDGVVRLWDLSGGAELLTLELGMGKVYSLAVSPDQMTFAAGVAKNNRIVLMDVPD